MSLLFFGTCCLCFGGGGGGMVGYKVATLGMMLLSMVLMLAGVAKPGQCWLCVGVCQSEV